MKEEDFYKELEAILEKLEKLSQDFEWKFNCLRSTDFDQLNLDDAKRAIGWVISHRKEAAEDAELCAWDSNEGGCEDFVAEGYRYCEHHLAITESR